MYFSKEENKNKSSAKIFDRHGESQGERRKK